MKWRLKTLVERTLQKIYIMSVPRRLSTSLSDDQAYPQICMQASMDFRAFNTFRRNPIYNHILEHVTEKRGQDYLELIRAGDPDIFGSMDRFRPNDAHGNPRVYEYAPVGKFSPTTLRYIKVLADLRALFGSLDDLNLVEIGVGYGGQCRVINAFFRPATYSLIDIRPALLLAQRYLDHYVLPSAVSYRTLNELGRAEYDLCISNYAFTELNRELQDAYLDKVILPSRRGYITYNELTPASFRSYKSHEIAAKIPGARLIEERPLTRPINCVIVWG